MSSDPISLAPVQALLSALLSSTKPVAFLVGSPLSMPDQNGVPGVPGIKEVIELARERVLIQDLPEFEKNLSAATPALQYQNAMLFLRDWYDQEVVNTVIRQAVRQARLSPLQEKGLTDEQLEHDLTGWYLPAGTRDLGKLVMSGGQKWSGPILTTNFDPLLSVAIAQEKGIPVRTILASDGRLHGTEVSSDKARSIVHLHGFWQRSATLHTIDQLTAKRANLGGSLKSLLRKHTLLVVAYGGWDDVFTQSLAEAVHDDQSELNVLWAFFENEPERVRARYGSLLEKTTNARIQGRLRLYGGVNCHELFGRLLSSASQRVPQPPSSGTTIPSTTSGPVPNSGSGKPPPTGQTAKSLSPYDIRDFLFRLGKREFLALALVALFLIVSSVAVPALMYPSMSVVIELDRHGQVIAGIQRSPKKLLIPDDGHDACEGFTYCLDLASIGRIPLSSNGVEIGEREPEWTGTKDEPSWLSYPLRAGRHLKAVLLYSEEGRGWVKQGPREFILKRNSNKWVISTQ